MARTRARGVVLSNGGVLLEEFIKPMELGGTRGLRYRIDLRVG